MTSIEAADESFYRPETQGRCHKLASKASIRTRSIARNVSRTDPLDHMVEANLMGHL